MNNTVSVALLGFTTIGLGLFAWSFAFGYFNSSTSEYSQEAGASIMQTSSILVIEHVAFKGDDLFLRLYNVGTIPLHITSITVSYPGDDMVYSFQDHGRVDVQNTKDFTLHGYPWVAGMVVRVHVVPEPLFDPSDPTLNVQWGTTVEWKD